MFLAGSITLHILSDTNKHAFSSAFIHVALDEDRSMFKSTFFSNKTNACES